MSATRRHPTGLDGHTILLLVALGVAGTAVGATWVAVTLGARIDKTAALVPADPFALFFGLLRGRIAWPVSATPILLTTLTLVILASIIGAVWVVRGRHRRRVVDGAAPHMGRGRALQALSTAGAKATGQRLGTEGWVGVPIGVTVTGRQKLFGSAEDMHIDIWGPRTGKTSSRAIPAILSAPGAVLTTSNKRDVLDATRDVRAVAGRVWAFDPQRIALEEATWWWNPLSYVTDDVKAAKLAEHFATGSRAGDSRADPYFDNAGQDLLAGFLLAAALGQLPITTVFTWTTTPGDDTPVDILRTHGYPQMADAVDGQVNGEARRRDSVYGTAAQMASCLKVRAIAHWVTPTGGSVAADSRPQFDPHQFVRSNADTLYSLSKEGKGTAGPLVTALTAATVEAAEEYATTQTGGRLRTPLLGVLDEAANVCRWHGLPDLYSHYGSRGIILMTILQSWSQGVEVWGRDGMRKLWSAANIAVYGGGVKELEFLGELSQLIGDYDKHTVSRNVGRGTRSTSHQVQRERILDVADLGALARGRAIVFASGTPATLIETVPWMTGPHATAVRASIAAHDPSAQTPVGEHSGMSDRAARPGDTPPSVEVEW